MKFFILSLLLFPMTSFGYPMVRFELKNQNMKKSLVLIQHSSKGIELVEDSKKTPFSSALLALIQRWTTEEYRILTLKNETPCSLGNSFGSIQLEPKIFDIRLCKGNLRQVALATKIQAVLRSAKGNESFRGY